MSDSATLTPHLCSVPAKVHRLYDPPSAVDKRNARTEARIARYVKGLTDAKLAKLYDGAVENGTAGDCWFCSMRVTDGPHAGKPLGDVSTDNDHLSSHLTESYYMASLVLNALRSKGYGHPETVFYMGAHSTMGDQVRAAVRTYLRKRLIAGRQTR